MDDVGSLIVKALVVDIEPDAAVKESMNPIHAADRLKEAATLEAMPVTLLDGQGLWARLPPRWVGERRSLPTGQRRRHPSAGHPGEYGWARPRKGRRYSTNP